MTYNFSTQKELFHIAYQILQDYGVTDWSFGGGTALSSLYYGHRMSYDIDIFSEDYSGIQTIIAAQKEITQNLGTSELEVAASSTGITFYLEGGTLKIDFVYSPALTSSPYHYRDVFGIENIKVQTPQEIIAKKLKYREKATIRDFVDYAVDSSGEVIAFDEFIPAYQEHYAPIGELEIYTIPNMGLDYKKILKLNKAKIEEMLSNGG